MLDLVEGAYSWRLESRPVYGCCCCTHLRSMTSLLPPGRLGNRQSYIGPPQKGNEVPLPAPVSNNNSKRGSIMKAANSRRRYARLWHEFCIGRFQPSVVSPLRVASTPWHTHFYREVRAVLGAAGAGHRTSQHQSCKSLWARSNLSKTMPSTLCSSSYQQMIK